MVALDASGVFAPIRAGDIRAGHHFLVNGSTVPQEIIETSTVDTIPESGQVVSRRA